VIELRSFRSYTNKIIFGLLTFFFCKAFGYEVRRHKHRSCLGLL